MLPAAEVGAELIPCQLQDSWEETKSINQKQVGKLGYFSIWHLCHKRKKSADSLRSLYFFGHDIGRQCLSSQWENSIECIECARICFQEPILRHLLLLKLETYMFSSCKPKAFHSGTCVTNERNQQTACGASTSLDMRSGADASHHDEGTP